jgi:N-acetylneuraminate synthase
MNSRDVFIIAEIGINHNGDLDVARRLIDAAVEAGCDAVKFQKRTIDTVYTQEVLDGPRESPWGTTQREQKEGLEFNKDEYDAINEYCDIKRIQWSASAWDCDSQEFLRSYNLPFNKVASAMITHLPLMEMIAEEGRHTYISTGMSTYEDIDKAVEIFNKHNCPFTLFHCVSTYPAKEEDSNLSVMNTLRNRYNCPVGFSGHEEHTLPSVLSAALGASAIERHITLDKNMYGSDQSASLELDEFKSMVQSIREVTTILGNSEKQVLDAEVPIAQKLRYWN